MTTKHTVMNYDFYGMWRLPAGTKVIQHARVMATCIACYRDRFILFRSITTGQSTRCKSCVMSGGGTMEERIWMHLRDAGPSGCLVWTGQLDHSGYGAIANSRRSGKVHRLMLALCIGRELSSGEMAIHSCDNRACCNPDHLRVGSAADNAADMANRGRSLRGERSTSARLTAADVLAIRAASGVSYAELARTYGVDDSTVAAAAKRRTWKHLDAQP